MAASDPAAAAGVWLNQLPLAQRMAASDFSEARLAAWGLGWVLVIALCLLILETGVLGRVRGGIERDRPRPWLTGAALAGLFAILLLAVKSPFDAFVAWRGDILLHQAGGAPATFTAHLSEALSGIAPIVVLAAVLIPVMQWLARRRPRTWPMIAGAALAVLLLGYGWAPYALSSGPAMAPLPAGPVREGVLSLIRETGLPATEVYQSAEPGMNADVTGGFGHAEVVVGPVFADATPAEARAFVGHVMGHYAHGDVFTIWLGFAVLTFLGLLLVRLGFSPLAKLLGAGHLAGPADQYSLDHAREPDGLAAALERDWDRHAVDPSPLAAAVFYTHPPLKSRLIHAMTWKSQHGE
jgi:STE24 endopeptidase